MLMPGRNGHAADSGWASNTGSLTLPDTLTLSSRTGNTPSEYRARYLINFMPGFESGTGDEFVAFITDEAGGGGSGSGSNGTDAGGYRYGFNGKENDNEVKGEGNQQDYGMRIYDPRLGRFLSVDPLTSSYPYYTPYQFAGNMPIAAVDLDGLEQYVVIYFQDQGRTTHIQIRTVTDNNGNLLNQRVHKIGDTKEIAKGNVLVFTSELGRNNTEKMKIVDSRNTPKSELTARELKIYKKYKEQEKENGASQSLEYGGPPGQFTTQEFENASTKTFNSYVEIAQPAPVLFQGQLLAPNKKFSFEMLPVFGDQSTPPLLGAKSANDLGKALQNSGVTSIIIQPKFYDASGGKGANQMQSNGKTFIQNVNEQYQNYGKIIQKASGGKIIVIVQYPEISTTSLSGKGLDIQTK